MVERSLLGHVDLHVHTIHSNCGKAGMNPGAVARIYESKGYQAIGFTDHYDPVLTPEKIRQTKEELAECDVDIRVLVGTEACVYLPGWPRQELRKYRSRHLDFCILAPSHRPAGAESLQFSRLPLEVQVSRVMDSFIEAVGCDFADAVAHPFAYEPSQIPAREEVLDSLPQDDLGWALEVARRNGIAMELSPRVLRLPESFLSRFMRLCRDIGVSFSIGGDVHALASIGNDALVLPLVRRFKIPDDLLWLPRRAE